MLVKNKSLHDKRSYQPVSYWPVR